MLTLLAAVAVAAPVEPVRERATCVYHCGSVCYWQEDIDEALSKGVSLHNSGSTLGTWTPSRVGLPQSGT